MLLTNPEHNTLSVSAKTYLTSELEDIIAVINMSTVDSAAFDTIVNKLNKTVNTVLAMREVPQGPFVSGSVLGSFPVGPHVPHPGDLPARNIARTTIHFGAGSTIEIASDRVITGMTVTHADSARWAYPAVLFFNFERRDIRIISNTLASADWVALFSYFIEEMINGLPSGSDLWSNTLHEYGLIGRNTFRITDGEDMVENVIVTFNNPPTNPEGYGGDQTGGFSPDKIPGARDIKYINSTIARVAGDEDRGIFTGLGAQRNKGRFEF